MELSARNQLSGTIKSVKSGAVMAEITVNVGAGLVTAAITDSSREQMGLKEGDEVEVGQIVLRLDDTVTRATLGVVRSQLDELMAREARLLAERDDADVIVYPTRLTNGREEASATTAIAGEQKLFESRRTARTGQRSQLRERVAQTNEEIRGLSAQHAAKESELELIAKELVGVADLYQKNLVSISRFTQLQRDQTRIQGERGAPGSDRADFPRTVIVHSAFGLILRKPRNVVSHGSVTQL